MSKRGKTRQDVYDFVCQYKAENKYSPSFRDIASGVGISVSTVKFHLENLKEEGLLTFEQKLNRSIVIL